MVLGIEGPALRAEVPPLRPQAHLGLEVQGAILPGGEEETISTVL